MTERYERGAVVSVDNPYAAPKPRSAVVLTDERRPPREDGRTRYTVVMLTSEPSFADHDWTVTLDATASTPEMEPDLLADSYVEPWATQVLPQGAVRDRHTSLTDEAMKRVAKSYARMTLR